MRCSGIVVACIRIRASNAAFKVAQTIVHRCIWIVVARRGISATHEFTTEDRFDDLTHLVVPNHFLACGSTHLFGQKALLKSGLNVIVFVETSHFNVIQFVQFAYDSGCIQNRTVET